MTIGDLLQLADKAGTIVILLLVLLGAVKGWWITGREHQEALKREEEWKQLALTGTKLAERAVQRPVDPEGQPTLAQMLAALKREMGNS